MEKEIPNIARAVELIVESFRQGGRLFYVGAGTSGRLGVLDASECPPTFGVEPALVQGIIAGGDRSLRYPSEDAEDNRDRGAQDLRERGVSAGDAVVAISASGRTPYCIGALDEALKAGARRIALVCNEDSALSKRAEVTICPLVGPEVLSGSTRMKAGTAHKMVLNMLSTVSMIKLGKVYTNLMVDLSVSNIKLRDRARRIVAQAAGCSAEEATAALENAGYNVKTAIVMVLARCGRSEAEARLASAKGFVRDAINIG